VSGPPSLDERLARLEQERQDADRRYNDALTALDKALTSRGALPAAAPVYDATRLPEANQAWNLPAGPDAADRSLKGRLRSLIWHVVGPVVASQRHFNATIVDHLNRNVAAHEQVKSVADALIASLDAHIGGQLVFEARLIELLQNVTLYVDTKDRSVAGRQDVLNAGLSAVTDSWLKRWESLAAREDRFVQRLASIDDVRATATLAQQTSLSLKREVERLIALREPEGSGPSRHIDPTSSAGAVPDAASSADLNAFKYLGFEDQFRGSQADISSRLGEYVELFADQSDVLDVGCGRGEFLELLRARGVPSRGIDVNQAMVEACRSRGLAADMGDALSYVSSLDDGSLGGLFAAQVVEHLAPEYLGALLETAAHKIRPGGLIVLETINPACWLAFFESYIRDLTHVRPIHPETLQYLLRVSGFHDVRLEYKSPVAESSKLQSVSVPETDLPPAMADVIQVLNENAAKLNARLFTFQDYAAIGRR
jgi:2-polyprenyl-3-methyl-5-hydroxy-6-metoxy-1,4-benzoquinol methylase